MSRTEGVLRTGPVRSSGYALKLRRVVNAALRPLIKGGTLTADQVNEELTKLNRALYSYIVEKYQIPKEAVVNVALRYTVEGGRFSIIDAQVDIYERDDILSNNVTEGVRRDLQQPQSQQGAQ
ncbi:MAG: DUF2258 domain-containing protein [Nitrososphaeria archaeon]|jgi:hypothetical protein